ncbi:MAG: hypothetical protein GXO74_03825 [Calditrichaeota bacterium]|nr:hypothetical protein [Calditrichota bacterium]
MSDQLIGQEIEAYCGKCKTDTIHLITTATDKKITKVMCKTCMSYHQFRKPKATAKAKSSDNKKAASKTIAKVKKPRARRDKWTRILNNAEAESAIEYAIGDSYDVETAIHHQKFGLGIVKNVIDSRKIEVLFHDGEKILAQNMALPNKG